jgi:FAD:protein FMN transferase
MSSLHGHAGVPERASLTDASCEGGASNSTAISRRALFTPHAVRPLAEPEYWVRIHRRAMACRFEVTLADRDRRHIGSARLALDEIDRIESRLTVFCESSLLSDVNRRAAREPVPVDDDLLALLRLCSDLHRETGGAFDVTTTPLSRCWGFLQRNGCLPAHDDIDRALSLVGMDGVELDLAGCTVRFARDGMALNLGGIGKGWALDAIARGLSMRRLPCALLSAGGSSVRAVGRSIEGWPIDLTSARAAGAKLARVNLHSGALGTSGAGEQFFEVDGTRYGHVLDPRTGWPATGTLSATVVTDRAAVADALSTAFLVGGPSLAEQYCRTHPNVLALVTPDDGSLRPVAFGEYPGATVEAA